MRNFFLFFFLLFLEVLSPQIINAQIRVGAECTDDYIQLIKNKRVGIVANQTSIIGNTHLVDSLLKLHISIQKIFTPEHGFRGNADAGEHVNNQIDSKTKIPLVSLYGEHKKPNTQDLENIDIVIFDIQDVGARFYTYISTMHYVMEACAEQNIPFVVLDRPNPNGHYIDGPVLDTSYSSFVGMHPIPIVHGMTMGEYASMINGEKWLSKGVQCQLTVIRCEGWNHKKQYIPPIAPSPNLKNIHAIRLYPLLCLTEGTVLSCGRGTDFPFEIIGHPNYSDTSFCFIPRSIEGASKNPPYKGIRCYGKNLRDFKADTLTQIPLTILLDAYAHYKGNELFFNNFFTKLAGNKLLQQQIENRMTETAIRQSWQTDLEKFKKVRKKYMLYEDFYE